MKRGFILAVCALSMALVNLVGADVTRPLKRYFPRSDRRLASETENRGFCSENYSPCTCAEYGFGHEIICLDVDTATVERTFFNSVTPTIYSLELAFTAAMGVQEITIPADLLSDKRVKYLYLRSSNDTNTSINKIKLTVDATAFRFTRDYTTYFFIENYDLGVLPNFLFLSGFSELGELIILNSDNVNLATLPQLPKLLSLYLWSNTGIQENAASFPSLTPARVTGMSFGNCQLDDDATSAILAKIAASTSAGSLYYLNLFGNNLTSVPAQVHALAQLAELVLSNNAINETRVGDLSFVSAMSYIDLDNNGLKIMEANTFGINTLKYGDFSSSNVYLESNLLEVFTKDVFYDILTQMNSQPPGSGSGSVYVQDNPFKCNCDLAWLIRDNRNLLPRVRNGKCGDFFHFEDLNESSFSDCPPS